MSLPNALESETNQNPSNSGKPAPTGKIPPLILAVFLLATSGLLFIQENPSMPTIALLLLGAVAALIGFSTSNRPGLSRWMNLIAGALTLAAVVWGPRPAEALFHKGLPPRIHFMGLDALSVPLMGALAAFSAALFLGATSLAAAKGKAAPVLATLGFALFAIAWLLPQPASHFSPIAPNQASVDDTVVMDVKGGKVVPLVFRTNDGAGLPLLNWSSYKNTSLATALIPVNPGPVKYLSRESNEYKTALRRIEASRPVGATLHPMAFWTWIAVLFCGLGLVVTLWMRRERVARYLSIAGAALVAYVPATNLILAATNGFSGLFDVSLTTLLALVLLDLAALAALTILLASPARSAVTAHP